MLTVLGFGLGTSSAAESTVELITYYHSNIQGSPMAATDEDGNTLWTQSYSPYGYRDNSEAQTSRTDLNRIGFTGHVEDKFGDRQLIYMQARYYDPALGRFLSADPVGFHESNPVSFNRYAYANNNPLKYVDPDGRIAETVWDVANVGMGLASLGYNVSEGNYWSAALDGLGVVADGLASVIPFVPGGAAAGIKVSRYGGEVTKDAVGRAGKQARLKKLANDPKLGRADRGWIKQEQNSIARGNRKTIRNPPGKDLAHERGREAAKGYGYKYSNLQDRKLHRTQHKYDNFGRKNNERPPQ